MADEFKVKVTADLDTTEAEKKLENLTKNKKKVKIDIDTSQLEKSVETINKTGKKKINVETKITGQEKVDGLTKGLNEAKKSANDLSSSFFNIAKVGAQIDVFRMIKEQAQEAVQAVKQIDDAIVELQMATNQSYSSVRQMMSGYNDMAKQLGATTTEVSSGADAWLRQGKSISETNGLIKESMVLSKVANLESADSTKYLTAMMKGYKKSAEEVGAINDALSAIDLVSATDAGGLAEATSRVAASAELAGVELNKLLGYEAAVGEASQESMSVIGNSFKTIFQRMSDIKAGKLELVDEDGSVETLSDVELVLKNAGIQLRDSANEFRDFDDVLDDTAKRWENLSSVQKAAVSKAFAGQRQANRFQLLMENYNKALEYMEIANKSQGTAMQKFEENYLNSLEAKQKTLRASFESLAMNTISRDSYSGVVDATQSLVEFLDKTNLVKGALAGLATGLAMKGFMSFTTGITKATIHMQNFQRALDLLKSGNIGENGIKQLGTYIDGLSKSQLKAVLSSEQLSTAQRMQILQASGMSKAQASATLAVMGLATAEGTATASTVSLSTAMKGLISTMLANPIFLVTAAVTAGVAVWQSYKQSVDEANRSARDSAQAFNESNANLNNHIAKVKELRSALASGTLSEEESYQAKSQLLDIQSQLIDTYGQQASQIDLVNGSLEKELELMNQLAMQNANKYLNENQDAIDRAEKEMTEERHAYLGQFSPDVEDGKELQKIIDKYKDKGLYTEDDGSGQVYIHFKGDVSEAEKTLNDFMTDVRALSEETGDGYGFLNNISQYTSKELGTVKDTIEEYRDIYNTALQSDMVSKGFGEDAPATVYKDYADAIEKYNEALSSGDTDSITKAKGVFDEVKSSVDDVLAKYPDYQILFDGVGSSLNESAIKAKEFGEAMGSSDFKDIVSQFKDLKDVDLKSISFDDDVTAKGEDALKAVVDKAIELGIVSDDSADSVSQIVDMLVELGLTGTQSTEFLAESFEKANTSIQKATSNIKSLREILSESYDGGGLSDDSLKSFREMFGDEADLALEKTANGYHVNEQALEKLQKKQNEMTKSDYLSALSAQYEALRTIDEQIAKASFMDEDISGLQAQRLGIEDQIASLKDLQLQYEAANSAYQQWQAAMSGGEEGDMYDSMFNNIEKVQELYDSGLTGTNDFEKYTDLISNRDLTGVSNEEIVAAYEEAIPKIQRYFTEGQQGAQNFLNDIQNINNEWAHMNEDGTWDINFGEGNDQAIADAIGIDVEAVQAIMRKLSDYGFEIELDQPVASLESLKDSAQTAKEALAGMNENTLSDINLDSSSFGEVTGDIDKVKEYIQTLNESDIEPDIKTERLEYANDILEYLVGKQDELGSQEIELEVNADELEAKIETAKSALDEFRNDEGVVDLSVEGAQEAVDNLQTLLYQKEQLNAPAVMSVETSGVDGELGSALAKIQEYQSAVQQLNAQTELKAQGVDIDTSSAEAKVSSLAAEIQGINPEITAKLGVDTTSLTTIQTSVAGITPEILVKAGVDASLVTGYTPEDKAATVKFEVDSSAVDMWSAPNKSGYVRYTAIWDIGNPPTKTQYVEIVETKRASGSMLAPSHAHGTLHAYANGRVALSKDEKALVNEMGQESRITENGVWELLPPGMHIENLKKGEIILNADQTEDLIKHGKAKGTGIAKAYSRGTGKFNISNSGSTALSVQSSSSAASSASQAIDNATDSAKEFSEELDYIEIAIDRIERQISEIERIADSAFETFSTRNDALRKQISAITSEISTQQAGYERYIQAANSVGLSEDYAQKIRDGVIDLETITDETLYDSISQYKDYYEKALDCRDAVGELTESVRELYQQEFENVVSLYDNIIDTFEHQKNMIESSIDQMDAQGMILEQKSAYLELIATEEESLKKLNEKRSALVNSLNTALSEGNIQKDSEAYYDMQKEINDVDEAIQDATTSIIEFKNEIKDLYIEQFDSVEQQYDNIVSLLEHRKNMIDSFIDQSEAEGFFISEQYYTALIGNEQETLNNLTKKREDLLAALQDGMKNGGIKEYSNEWYEMQQQINDVNEAIQDANTNILDFGNSIREIKWDIFDTIQDRISSITTEADFLIELMSSKDLFDDKGQITEHGMSTMGLHGVNYNTYMSQADEYRKEMEKIDSELKIKPYDKELIKRRQELLELQQESILAAEDEKNAIKDLVEDGIQKELDALQELIDKHLEALDSQKDLYDYQKEIAEKQKEISEIEKQLEAYRGDDSEEGSANRQQLQDQLEDLKLDLEETQYDKSIAEQKKLLDELYTDYETVLNMRLDNIDLLITDVINNVNTNATTIRDTLKTEAANVGYQMSSSMTTIWNSASTEIKNISGVITTYGEKFTTATTSVQTAINDLKKIVQDAINAANEEAKKKLEEQKKQEQQQQKPPTSTIKPVSPPSNPNANKVDPPKPPTTQQKPASGGDGVPRVGDVVTLKAGQWYYYDSWGTNPSGNMFAGQRNAVKINGYSGSEYGGQAYNHGEYGVSLNSADDRYQLGWVRLDQIEGYAKGTRNINRNKWVRVNEKGDELTVSEGTITTGDGTVLRKVHPGDAIFTKAMTGNLFKLAENADKILAQDHLKSLIGDSNLPTSTPTQNSTDINQQFDITIAIDKVMDYNDLVAKMQSDKKFAKLMQSIVLDPLVGKGNLAKYRIKF